jgi:hypothetical protein
MFRILTATFLSLSLAFAVPAATAAPKSDKNAEVSTRGPKKQLQTIVFAGLAGAILGLSTLSFYGRPQDKLNNIAVGAAVGIIIGTVYSTFRVATEPHDFTNFKDPRDGEMLALQPHNQFQLLETSQTPKMAMTFSF